MDLSAIGIVSLVITVLLGLVVRTAWKKITEAVSRDEFDKRIKELSDDRRDSAKEMWKEIRENETAIAEIKGRMEK
jgi:hypothetical protein